MGAVANHTVEVTLAGRSYQVRRIGLMRKLAIVEAHIIESATRRIRRMAEAFEDPTDRAIYIRDQLAELPTGEKLEEQVKGIIERKESPHELVCKLVGHALDVTTQEAEEITDEASLEELTILFSVMGGGMSPNLSTGEQSPDSSRSDSATDSTT
jgi:hypothetical protein